MPRLRCGLIPIAVLCGHTGMSAAQPADSPIILWWEVPAGSECPSTDVVSDEVERLLGGKPSASAGRRLFARARVVQKADGSWMLTVRTAIAGEEADGERLLQAPSCGELGSAAALIVALGFDAAAVAAQAERTAGQLPDAAKNADPTAPKANNATPEQPPVEPPIVPDSPKATSSRPRTENPARVRFGLNLGAGGDFGSFSGPALSGHVSGLLRYRKLELIASFTFFPLHRTPLEDRPTVGGDFSLYTGGLLACGTFLAVRALGLGVCGGAELGQMRAKGYGVSDPGEGRAFWAAARAGGTLTIALTRRLRLRFDGGVAVPFTRNRYFLERIGVVHDPSSIAGRTDIGVEFHF